MFFDRGKLTLQKPVEITLVFIHHGLIKLIGFAGKTQILSHICLLIGKLFLQFLLHFLFIRIVESRQSRKHDVEEMRTDFLIMFEHCLLDILRIMLLLKVISYDLAVYNAIGKSLEEAPRKNRHGLVTIYFLAHNL